MGRRSFAVCRQSRRALFFPRMKLRLVVEHDRQTKRWAAFFPELPGSGLSQDDFDDRSDFWPTSSKSARPAKDFEGCETVSTAESAQCPLDRCPAQLVTSSGYDEENVGRRKAKT